MQSECTRNRETDPLVVEQPAWDNHLTEEGKVRALNNRTTRRWLPWLAAPALMVAAALAHPSFAEAQGPATEGQTGKSSYDQVTPTLLGEGTFQEMMGKDKADKPEVMARQKELLE